MGEFFILFCIIKESFNIIIIKKIIIINLFKIILEVKNYTNNL
jgi:hypothetical protein